MNIYIVVGLSAGDCNHTNLLGRGRGEHSHNHKARNQSIFKIKSQSLTNMCVYV